ADGFGIQDVYVIENQNEFDTEGTVSLGAHQWLTINRYNDPGKDNVSSCFQDLKSKGYTIVATTPHERDSTIHEIDASEKTALVFGTELEGISEQVKREADGFVKIPMFGFSESFNISVSAAVMMYELTNKLRSSGTHWGLNEEYKLLLKHQWIKQTIKAGDKLEEKFLKERNLSG
ncbi:MAG: RNA methyltransferase, partial [Balneolales bacterium]|nr:RNA methyltransferase [Balneolales bacterium]